MVCAGCHAGNGMICLDEKNSSAACNRNYLKCEWVKYPDIAYICRTAEMVDGSIVYIPSNAIGINAGHGDVSWLEPINKKKDTK